MNKKHSGINTCVTVYPKCIVWNLPSIACLGIKTGDTLDEITFAITKKICEISQPLDLSNISIECLIEKLGAVEPVNKTISTYLQLLIDNSCKLADLIAAIGERIDDIENPSLVLNLKCLQPLDDNDNPLNYNVQSVLQILINETCDIRDSITDLNGAIGLVNQRIDNLPPPYIEPNVTATCIYTGTKRVSQAVTLMAADYCTYKGSLGTIAEIQKAIGQQCDGLNTEFATNLNFVQNVQTLAQTVNNLWIAFCDRDARLRALEECACKFTCDDIKIGFTTTFNDNNTVTLQFTSGAGTSIPLGFTDCGSILTIKNDSGTKTLPIPVVVAQEGLSIEVDVSMFTSGEYLTFDLNSKLCNEAISCSQCTTKLVRNTAGCCLITNNGTSNTTITYKVCGISN